MTRIDIRQAYLDLVKAALYLEKITSNTTIIDFDNASMNIQIGMETPRFKMDLEELLSIDICYSAISQRTERQGGIIRLNDQKKLRYLYKNLISDIERVDGFDSPSVRYLQNDMHLILNRAKLIKYSLSKERIERYLKEIHSTMNCKRSNDFSIKTYLQKKISPNGLLGGLKQIRGLAKNLHSDGVRHSHIESVWEITEQYISGVTISGVIDLPTIAEGYSLNNVEKTGRTRRMWTWLCERI
ncbi:hypothetical protein COV93_01520 [Candidatus Woesearchaeota archaeon CG11_big_fil_rev_8_21_14_0_20_43_8]|nr:MAG: hypothetical protein COV93_01520 [Candidatus Woesearchaeota archaeon CG11_big_fil_rev_8_21_14_0_20_43_8]PIO09033.1 MAG: hypothetical protein COT47_00140 [Candidatus Woesearchaeota archaeon CG08_land_8_20_14_0_20_43_7]